MSIDNVVFIVLLAIALAALVVLLMNNFRMANLIPIALVRDLIKAAVDTALASAERYAITTENTADDELIRLIREEVEKLFAMEALAAKARMQTEVAKQLQVVQTVKAQHAYEPVMHVEPDEAAS